MLTQENFAAVIDEVMHGAIDMHVHFGPDMPPTAELNGIGTARQVRGAGRALNQMFRLAAQPA